MCHLPSAFSAFCLFHLETTRRCCSKGTLVEKSNAARTSASLHIAMLAKSIEELPPSFGRLCWTSASARSTTRLIRSASVSTRSPKPLSWERTSSRLRTRLSWELDWFITRSPYLKVGAVGSAGTKRSARQFGLRAQRTKSGKDSLTEVWQCQSTCQRRWYEVAGCPILATATVGF